MTVIKVFFEEKYVNNINMQLLKLRLEAKYKSYAFGWNFKYFSNIIIDFIRIQMISDIWYICNNVLIYIYIISIIIIKIQTNVKNVFDK